MSHLEGSECIEALIPFVKAFSFTWFHLQAAKRRYQKQHETPMPVEMERVMKEDFMNQRYADKIKWTVRILAKLRKDIKRECRTDLVKTITEGSVQSPCIISNADTKNKMRRIDCLRQADKVWRLDVVMVVLFRGIPLESTDGERLSKCKDCQHPALCINPYHIVLHVKELEVYLVNFINNTQVAPPNIIPSVFSTSDLQQMATTSISDGGSTKEILGADYLGSMLKMETDDYADAQPISTNQQPDLLKMCRSRKPSLSSSPRTAKRRRTLNNTCSADEGDSHDLNDGPAATYDVYESKMPASSNTEQASSAATCRLSTNNESNSYATYQSQQQDEMNTAVKPVAEPSKNEPGTPRPPYSQIGIHNHVSLNLHFNNQQQQQQQQHQQQQQQAKTLSSSSTSQSNADAKLISDRFIESIVQRFNDNQQQQQQQQQRTSSHPHTIEYFHQTPPAEPTTTNTAKPMNKPFSKSMNTTAINILPSQERAQASSSSYDPSFIQAQQQSNDFKDSKNNSNNNNNNNNNPNHNNCMRLSSAADRVLPAFHTFSELKSYLQTIGLDVELVPASNPTPESPQPPARSLDPVQQRLPTTEQHQYQVRPNTVNVSQTPQQPQIVMLSNNDGNSNTRHDETKCNRSSSISVPPNILTEKLLEYASSTSSIRHPHHSSRTQSLSSQQRRSPSKLPIVSDIANLLSVSNNNNPTKEQPIVQQVTRHTLLPPPPPPPPLSSSSPAPSTGPVYHHISSADKVTTMSKRDLIHDDVHLHDREVEEYMNMAAAVAAGRATKARKTANAQAINDATSKSMVLESGSASNSNDSNVSSASSSLSSMNNTGTNSTPNNNLTSTNSISKSKSSSTISSQDSRNICDILLMLYEQERTRSTHLQKQIEQVSRQQRSRNSSGQSHSSESQTGLETPQGPPNGTNTSTRMLSPATWPSTTGKEKTSAHIQQTLKFDSTTPMNGSPPEPQDCSPPDPSKSGLSPTKVVQFCQSIGSGQNLIPRPVPMVPTNDGLVRHSSSSSSHAATPTGSASSSNNGILYTPGNRIFQSPLGQAFAALSPALSPFLSPSTSRAGTPSELMIIPADLFNVLNSRIWSEDELLQAFVTHLDSGGSGRRSRVNNEEPKSSGKPTSVANNNNNNGNGKAKSIEK